MTLLTALMSTLAGKAAAATAGVALAGAGLAVASDVAADDAGDGLDTAQEQVDQAAPDVPDVLPLPDLPQLPNLPEMAANVPEIVTVVPTEVGDTSDEGPSEDAFGQSVAEDARNDAREQGVEFGRSVAAAARDGAGEGDDGEANDADGLRRANEVAAVTVPANEARPVPEVPAEPEVPANDVTLPDEAAAARNAEGGLEEAVDAPSPRGPRD